MITLSVRKIGTPLTIIKMRLRFNELKILTICHDINVICNSSLSKVLDTSLGILTNTVIKYCETSFFLDSWTKVSVKDKLIEQSFSLTILHEGDEISIREGKMLHTVMSQLIASSSSISLTYHAYDNKPCAKSRSKYKSESKSDKKPSSSETTPS